MVQQGLTTEKQLADVRQQSRHLFVNGDVQAKIQGTHALWEAWQNKNAFIDTQRVCDADNAMPGRPERPELVSPKLLAKRAMHTVAGRAALIHALTHIEFNAINLALDVIWRFAGMPEKFYTDWLQVAKEEAYHFSLLAAHLETLGYHYGDFSGHNSLWEMADKTSHDVLARMALVPRVYEARGLDATPQTRDKLAQAGDSEAAQILDIILRDEIGHVTIGNYWFAWLCAQKKVSPVTTFQELVCEYKAPVFKGPFNLAARKQAGFTDEELALFEKMAH